MPLAPLIFLILIDPVVSETISKTKDKRIAVETVRKIANEPAKNRRPCDFLQSTSPLCIYMSLT